MARRRAATRNRGRSGPPGWLWLLAGMLIGLGIAWYLFARGYIPQPAPIEPQSAAATGKATDSEEIAPATEEQKTTRYDFFTVLPEMEVVVPEDELSRQTRPETPSKPVEAQEQYLLQVGSFKALADAEQRKARLALLGETATIQTVTVNDTTWHRVRIGPVSGARQAEAKRNKLTENNIESLVMKNPR